jgi:sugar (pentulose or hexulose) kinase
MTASASTTTSTLVAAIDLGTSRIRLGVLATHPSRLEILSEGPNQVLHGADGAARCRFSTYISTVEEQLAALGRYCQEHHVAQVRISLTGQVSSVIRWQEGAAAPREDEFPIWMDTTCRAAVPDLARLWGGGGGRTILGTCMPAASNWLAVKIRDLHQRSAVAAAERSRYVQLQDALFLHLTGSCLSHPSAQISLVDHRSGRYAPEMLRFLQLDATRLPSLDALGQCALSSQLRTRFALPETIIHVAPQDTHAALYGMCAKPGEGMLLAGTSEIIGICEAAPRAQPPSRMVSAPLGDGWMVYGSSASGGSSIDWLMKGVLRRGSPQDLTALSLAAEAIAPGADGLICLPYFSGERAPLWNSELTGSFIGVRAHHTDAHLLRALLESVAYARRQAAEALECPLPARFLAAGGGTVSQLWNRIRATVLERPLGVMTTPDLALIGAIRWAHRAAAIPDHEVTGLSRMQLTEPEPAWAAAYRQGYADFTALQRRLHLGAQLSAHAPLEATHA